MPDDYVAMLTDKVQEQLLQFANEEDFKQYLRFLPNMSQYSLENQLLIYTQNPNARHLAGFQAWKQQGRAVTRGERAIRIRAPIFEPREVRDTTKQANAEAKVVPFLVGYKWVSVFDIAQTTGPEVKRANDFVNSHFASNEQAAMLYGRLKDYLNEMTPLTITSQAYTLAESRGYYVRGDERIVINEAEPSGVAKLKTLFHEYAHAQMHHTNSAYINLPRGHKEAQAEAVAYSMMAHLGFDTSGYSLGYIATWAKSPETMKQALKEIRETLQQTIPIVDRLTYPRLSQNLAQKVNETSQSYSVLLSQAQLRVYLPAIVELHNVTAIEAYDRTTSSIALLKYHPVAKMLFDDQGMLVKTDRLEQRNVLLLNVLDTNDQAKKHFKRFNEQFTLQDGNEGVKLTHNDTGTVIATYADLAEGKHKVNQLMTQEGVLKGREMGVEVKNVNTRLNNGLIIS